MEERYNSLNNYFQNIFTERVHRINLDAGFNCPNIDGSLSDLGCSFCNNKAFGVYARKDIPIETQIEQSIEFYGKKMGVKKFVAYFQSFSNTYGDADIMAQRFEVIRKYPQIVGLFVSTRPDCIDREKIEVITRYQRDYLVWMEYGLQTTHNHLLEAVNRNHTYEDFLSALELTRSYGLHVGVHLIFGLPGESYEEMMVDAQRLGKLDIQGIKFHVLHVLKDTPLEQLYYTGSLKLLTFEEYVKVVCDALEAIPAKIVILRLVSSAFKDYLVAPDWVADKNKAITAIREELTRRDTKQGYYTAI